MYSASPSLPFEEDSAVDESHSSDLLPVLSPYIRLDFNPAKYPSPSPAPLGIPVSRFRLPRAELLEIGDRPRPPPRAPHRGRFYNPRFDKHRPLYQEPSPLVPPLPPKLQILEVSRYPPRAPHRGSFYNPRFDKNHPLYQEPASLVLFPLPKVPKVSPVASPVLSVPHLLNIPAPMESSSHNVEVLDNYNPPESRPADLKAFNTPILNQPCKNSRPP
ncbi:hypothetical protein LZ554_008721 [Drepanopeziza brunnea f. sp. 'monogermtubi']|nr:hypothetical protein LZ554_008721 [Drepanopeziza brunnea f. sp. 'monogermtubi']